MTRLLLFAFGLFAATQLSAQSPCGDSTTALSGNVNTPTLIGLTDNTPAPVFTSAPANPTLPNLEYLITNESQLSSDSSGAPIVGASLTGIVRASDFNISTCETFAVTPIAYSLTQLRQLTQALLDGEYSPGVSCCAFVGFQFPGFCDTLNNAGIYDSTDINSITDFFGLANALLGDGNTMSISTATSTIDFLNGALGFLGACNGGVTQICYAVEPTGADYYTVPGITPTSLTITPDTGVIIGLGNTFQFNGAFGPSGACPQQLFWGIVGGNNPNVAINDATGRATGNGFDTVQVFVVSYQDTTLRDTATLIIRDVQANVVAQSADMQVLVAPNPVGDMLQVSFFHRAASRQEEYLVRLMDLSGKVIFAQTHNATEGLQRLQIETQALPQGVYFLQIQHGSEQFTQKVVK